MATSDDYVFAERRILGQLIAFASAIAGESVWVCAWLV